MDKEEKIVYIRSQITCAEIEMEAMKVANIQSRLDCKPLAYEEKDFNSLSEKYGIHHNAVIGYLYH